MWVQVEVLQLEPIPFRLCRPTKRCRRSKLHTPHIYALFPPKGAYRAPLLVGHPGLCCREMARVAILAYLGHAHERSGDLGRLKDGPEIHGHAVCSRGSEVDRGLPLVGHSLTVCLLYTSDAADE